MKVLLDTNILIALEDTERELDSRLAEIKQLATLLSVTFCLHPDQRKDIANDKDEARKGILMSRCGQYPYIDQPPEWRKSDKEKFEWLNKTGNESIDNSLLCALYSNAVHLLLTEDKGIHSKAIRLGIQDRVYYIDSFLNFLRQEMPHSIEDSTPLGVKQGPLHLFRADDPFFTSLHNGYKDFGAWFAKCAREERQCWYVGEPDQIVGIVIFKEERDETVTDRGVILLGKALKLCTFKVDTAYRGRKIGERLIYTAFRFAHKNKTDWVYLTIEGSQPELETLCQDFGFKDVGIDIKNHRDHVWCKDMREPSENDGLSNFEFSVVHYPFFRKSGGVSPWIIPIQPRFHNLLFPDQSDMQHWFEEMRNDHNMYAPCSNTIKKAYLCHSPVKKIAPGDIVYFYRSHEKKHVQCVGIVEKCVRSTDRQEVMSLIAKRSVYTSDDVSELVKKETLVILFRLQQILEQPITREVLKSKGIRGNIQSIRRLENTLS